MNPRELFYHKGNWVIIFPAGGFEIRRVEGFVHIRIPKVISIGVVFR